MDLLRKTLMILLCAIMALTSFTAILEVSPVKAEPLIQSGVSGPGKLATVAGSVYGDRDPAKGALTSFGATGAFALDSGLNSIGADLGSMKTFNTIELQAASANANRMQKGDLSLYISQDNVAFTKVRDWDFMKLGNTILLYNFGQTARYVKVHNHFDGSAAEFSASNVQDMISVHNLPPGRWTASGGGDWLYRKSVAVSNPNGETIYDRAVYVEKSELDVQSLIAAGHIQADLRDVRFADAGGMELPFYMDDGGFFVRIPEMQPLASQTLYMYYGNPQAVFVGAGQEALQVEYGNKTLTTHDDGGVAYGANIKPVRLKDGTLMLMAQTDITRGIYAKYSLDDGKTWTAPEPLISPGSRAGVSLDSPGGAYVDPNTGVVHIVFYSYFYYGVWDGVHSCLDQSVCRTDMYSVKSTGFNGHKPVFGTPVPMSGMVSSLGNPINYALTYSNPIRLSTGRLVASFAFVVGNDGTFAASVAYSDDDGVSWTKSASDLTIPAIGGEGGVSETAIIELADGTLRIYARQQRGDKTHLGSSVSTDHGATWSPVEDSDVLSSNTFPALSREGSGSILLTWSGHNAMGADSYQRNDLTVAYSDDETQTWNGYRDVFGRTQFSTPGWYSNAETVQATESDKVPAGDDAYLFSWSGVTMKGSLLVEDFDRFLRRSHGALDDFEYEKNAAAPDNGSRLANDYWWKTTSSGVVSTSANRAKQGERSLRIFDNANNITLTGASRLFLAVRKGSVRFSVNGSSFANGLNISLQEGYSQQSNAVGTAYLLQVTPDGSLAYSSSPATYNRKVGFLNDDTNPSEGNLGHLGYVGLFALDYKYRSIGMDLGRVETIREIKLHDNNVANRIGQTNLSVYVSDTNAGDWRLVTGWTFAKTNESITIGGLSTQARFVKVRQNYGDTAFTFVNQLLDMMEVNTGESRTSGYKNGDTDPVNGNINYFGGSGLFGLDYDSRSIGIDLGGVETVQTIKLWDNDGVNRLTASNLSVYASNTNNGDWVPVNGWTFAKTNGNIVLGGMSVQARYIKVHQSYPDTGFTFVNDLQDMLTVQTAEHNPMTGFLHGDTNPLAGNLSNFTHTGPVALDYSSRSVGVDLGGVETIKEIRLRDSDGTNRLTSGDLSVYASDTNAGDWREITGWIFSKTGGTITLGGMSVDARYVKVHQRYADTAFTFSNALQDMMTVKTIPTVSDLFHDLPVPTVLPLNQWSDIRLDFDLAEAGADVYVNGVHKGQIPAANPGPVVTHLLLSTGAGAGTDVYIDDLVVQDESVGLPAAGAVGEEQSSVDFDGLIRATEHALTEPNAHGIANALTVKLRHAEQAEKEGKPQVKLASIRAYMEQVKALGVEGKIDLPDYLIRLAELL